MTGAGRVAGKTAVVTGATSGIGKGLARLLAAEGAHVVISGRNAERGSQVVEGIRATGGRADFIQADLGVSDQCRELIDGAVERFGGKLDILVNNAAIFPRGTLENTTEELWDKIFDINIKAVFLLCQRAFPTMKEQGGGVVINMGSVNSFRGGANLLPYSTSKGAMLTFTRNLARAHNEDRVRFHIVNPGWIHTEGEHQIQLEEGRPEDWAETANRRMPFGRMLTPEDIAPAVLYLASDEAACITGVCLTASQARFDFF